MQATFETTFETIQHAAKRSGVSVDATPPRFGYRSGTVAIRELVKPIGTYVSASGDTNAIMRIIGALADDGDSSLRTVC